MNKYKRKISMILALLMILPISIFAADGEREAKGEILVLGNDLTPKMIQDLKGVYGIDGPIEEIIITNQEEHEALGSYISADVITNKSMSSAYVKLLDEGQGIDVTTNNINWVTEDMYRNALVTAGIKDAEVKVAGPFPVSGTAALTGMMKAYEQLTGEKIPEEQKDIANDEMVTTAELSDEIGKEEAEKIITEVKIFIAENDIKDPEVIKEAVKDSAESINIVLTEEQIQKIVDLMERLSKLDLDVDDIKNQLGDIINKLDEIQIDTEEVKGVLGKIFQAISDFFSKFFN